MIDQYSLDRTGWARFSDDMRMRYRLARALDGKPLEVDACGPIDQRRRRVVFAMLNPSTADAFELDPTVRRCVGFARAWGAEILEVVNVFALRSTDPRALYATEELGDDAAADEQILFACAGAMRVIAGWGVHGAHRDRGLEVRLLIQQSGQLVRQLGLTKDGHPRHPLYLKSSTEPQPWL